MKKNNDRLGKEERMRKVNKTKTYRLLILCLLAGIMLFSKIDSAVAWLQLGQKMSNEFFSPVVDIEIVKQDVGTNYTIQNKSNTTVFVRVEIVGTKTENNVIVSSLKADPTKVVEGFTVPVNIGNDWKMGIDGYFYYLHPLKVDGEEAITSTLLKPDSQYSSDYELQVFAQAVLPENVESSWKGASLDETLSILPPQ